MDHYYGPDMGYMGNEYIMKYYYHMEKTKYYQLQCRKYWYHKGYYRKFYSMYVYHKRMYERFYKKIIEIPSFQSYGMMPTWQMEAAMPMAEYVYPLSGNPSEPTHPVPLPGYMWGESSSS
ncbi:hypothetical protein [Aneurinibacillus terranovensis]|uniref:hypothetical protein n=1 Tax=Aneurinibacillus terranovensis TaxID=278991 RepID=UPI000487720E|nr:hypothetical protein [Aneurinibacillus terranovensis]